MRPGGIKKLLDFDFVAVRVFEEAVVDVIGGVVGGWLENGDAFLFETLELLIDLGGDEGEDAGLGLGDDGAVLAEADEGTGVDLEDVTGALIEDKGKTEGVLIEVAGGGEIGGVVEGDELMELFGDG